MITGDGTGRSKRESIMAGRGVWRSGTASGAEIRIWPRCAPWNILLYLLSVLFAFLIGVLVLCQMHTQAWPPTFDDMYNSTFIIVTFVFLVFNTYLLTKELSTLEILSLTGEELRLRKYLLGLRIRRSVLRVDPNVVFRVDKPVEPWNGPCGRDLFVSHSLRARYGGGYRGSIVAEGSNGCLRFGHYLGRRQASELVRLIMRQRELMSEGAEEDVAAR